MEVDYNRVVLRALLEMRRHQVLTAKLNPSTEAMYPNAYTYALLHRVCPAFDNQPETWDEAEQSAALLYRFPFDEVYDVPRAQVVEVAELLDEKVGAKEKITYSDLERMYQGSGMKWESGHVRPQLITVCRYLFLHGMFDEVFWQHFTSNRPSEASDITRDWNNSEINDWAGM
jgi:hypothetical protein